jgi:hypothetical protein
MIPIAKLTGADLDYYVGRAMGIDPDKLEIRVTRRWKTRSCYCEGKLWAPTEEYERTGRLITFQGISIMYREPLRWDACLPGGPWFPGRSPLEAAGRAFVAGVLNASEVEPPATREVTL